MNRLPEVYYQRRRAAAAAILVIVVLLLVAVFALNRPDTSAPAAQTSTVITTTTAAPASASSEPTETETETETQAPAATEASGCTLADLEITAETDFANYPADSQPVFYMTVRNPTQEDCVINLDQDVLRFEVYAMDTNQRMWADIDCNPAVGNGEETFAAGSERYFEATWSRTTSAPEQCEDRAPVPAGSYYLHTVVGDNPSQPATFNLQ
ncbi:hypothetical protein [Corynebacterium kozikiae]|uniref:hypothetical protein n=1 Tax=Corynebacterium kozikiae TaxID=2968469 RepID=UPI00211C436B|nr:hypothetical protein [Corynebacterium sp. 76QC2CO]MCQ9343631.1 hypothetical protein [Corynebacterium sp. 76QC2CO]